MRRPCRRSAAKVVRIAGRPSISLPLHEGAYRRTVDRPFKAFYQRRGGQFCDECQHWDRTVTRCLRRHRPRFLLPQDMEDIRDLEWGWIREGCADYRKKETA